MLHDLKPEIVAGLKEQIILEVNQKSNPETITINEQNYLIRDITKGLRNGNLKESIKWMKTNLPAGVTGL